MNPRDRRMMKLQADIGVAIDNAGCNWSETASAVGFCLAVILDANEDDTERIAMAKVLTDKLTLSANAPGTYGIPERMQ